MGLTMRMTYSIYLLYSNTSSKLSHVFILFGLYYHTPWKGEEIRVFKVVFLTIDFLKENIYNFSFEFVYNLRAA